MPAGTACKIPLAAPHLDDALRQGRQDEVGLAVHRAALGVAHHVALEHAVGLDGLVGGARIWWRRK